MRNIIIPKSIYKIILKYKKELEYEYNKLYIEYKNFTYNINSKDIKKIFKKSLEINKKLNEVDFNDFIYEKIQYKCKYKNIYNIIDIVKNYGLYKLLELYGYDFCNKLFIKKDIIIYYDLYKKLLEIESKKINYNDYLKYRYLY